MKTHLVMPYLVATYLLSLDVKDLSDGAMVEGLKLFFVLTG
jgi:hypothetical protein